MADRRDIPPTWRSSVNRALIAAGIFFALLVLLFGQPVAELAGAVPASCSRSYIPMGYYIDRFFFSPPPGLEA